MSRFSFDLTLTFNRFGLPWYEAHRLLALETVVITLYGMTTTDSLSGGETTTNSFEDIQVILQELLIMLIHPLNLGNSSDRQFALSPAAPLLIPGSFYRGVTNGGANAETPPAWQITLL